MLHEVLEEEAPGAMPVPGVCVCVHASCLYRVCVHPGVCVCVCACLYQVCVCVCMPVPGVCVCVCVGGFVGII